ncbi:MAG: acyl-CoA dehydrogenase family protein [Bacteroidales bacterium]|nr:acyl-CoA dehydrogenase family protein [Bacteroidales bacterium]
MANFYNDNKDLKFHLHHPLMKKIVSLKEKDFEDAGKYDYAPVDFEDTMDSYEKILEIVGEISGDIIDPNAESVDKEGPQLIKNEVVYARGTQENYEALTKAGLVGLALPRRYDGLNFSVVAYVMSGELVSRADAGFANIWGLQDCAETMHEFASEELKDEFLPRFSEGATAAMVLTEPDAGSDLQAVQLKGKPITATYDKEKDTYYLNGVKRFITNGDADIQLVLARSEDDTADARGLSLFVYDRTDQAVVIRRLENKLGIKGSPTCEMVYTNAPAKLIGDRKMGLIKYVMSLMNSARLGIGAQSTGLGEAAYREALKYAKERVQFGKPIIEFPAVYEMLRTMEVRNKAMRSLLYETARYIDIYKAYNYIAEDRSLTSDERKEAKKYQRLADVFTPLLKLISSEYANSIAYDSIQIHGGAGFMKDFPIERIYRDARITSIYEGTSQLQVVAAIKGVSAGGYLNRIKEFEEEKVNPELEYLRKILQEMTSEYEAMVSFVNERNDNEYLDFHARRLVEMAGNIIIGYLLLQDTMREEEFRVTAELFIKTGRSENIQKADYIKNSELKDLGIFKYPN